MENLALQVGQLNNIRIDQNQCPDTGGREIQRYGRPQPTHPDNQHPRPPKRLLPAFHVALGAFAIAAASFGYAIWRNHRRHPRRMFKPRATGR